MKSMENNRIFRTTSKFSQEDLNEVRNRIINTKGLQTITELENIVNFPDIVRLPRRDAIVWFSMYSVSIANMYKEHDSQGHPTIASFHSLLTYINKNKEIIDETFVFKSDFYYLIRNRLYLYKLNSIFRKIIGNQGLYSNINWTKNIPFTDNEQRILSFLQQPNKIIKEIAYWKYKTNYNVTLKYVYMIDRISRKINQVIKNYQHKSQPFSYFGLRKVTKLEFQFYEEIKPILSDFYDFYNEICPLDDRILPWIDQQTEIIPNYIRIIGANKSKLREYLLEKGNIYDEKGLLESVRILDSPAIFVKDFIKLKKKEIINERYLREKKTYFHNSLLNGFRIRDMVSEIEERYEDYELYLFDGGITVLILIELIEAFIKHFLSSYSKKMQSEYKISFFTLYLFIF